jgi:hypothetical protein
MLFATDPLPDPFDRLRQLAHDAPEPTTLTARDEAVSFFDEALMRTYGKVITSVWPTLTELGAKVKQKLLDWPLTKSSMEEAMDAEINRLLEDEFHLSDLKRQWSADRQLMNDAFAYSDFLAHEMWLNLPDYARNNVEEPPHGDASMRSRYDEWAAQGAVVRNEPPRVPDLFRYDWARPKPVMIVKQGRREELKF